MSYASNAMSSPVSASAEVTLAAPTAGMARLEHFLDAVLKQTLQQEMAKRDRFIDLAAQCNQLQGLCEEMRTLSSSSLIPVQRTASTNAASATASPRQKNKVLVNLGNHFYTPATIRNTNVICLNIGCGVVLEMPTEDAVKHLKKREKLAKEALERQNVQILRLKYRIRLVTEAIRRLHEKYTTGGTVEQ